MKLLIYSFLNSLAVHFQIKNIIILKNEFVDADLAFDGIYSGSNITLKYATNCVRNRTGDMDQEDWQRALIFSYDIASTCDLFSKSSQIILLPMEAIETLPPEFIRLDTNIYAWSVVENDILIHEVFKANNQIMIQFVGSFNILSG